MRAETILNEWLGAIEPEKGRKITLDSDNVAHVSIDGDFAMGITVNPDTRMIGFVAFLLNAPDISHGTLLRAILSMNLALLAVHNATLAVDERSGQLVFGRTVSIEPLDQESFFKLLLQTIEIAKTAREGVENAGKLGENAEATMSAEDAAGEEVWLKL